MLIEPKEPLPVTHPLAEEDEISFLASRDAFMMYSLSKAGEYNLTLAEVKQELRDKLKDNQVLMLCFILVVVALVLILLLLLLTKRSCGTNSRTTRCS